MLFIRITFFLVFFLLLQCVEVPSQPDFETGQILAPTYKSYVVSIHVEKDDVPLENAQLELYIHHASYTKSQTTYTAETNSRGNYYWEIDWEEVHHHTYELSVQEPLLGAVKRFNGRVRFNEKDRFEVEF
ncbi:MAG: hypothetical protein K9N46_05570 [Candidatus Marinimicrobia bacterium]|nr:hypothetical protein [Candidatus Neomarinimicrobiota bacterium]MCF7880192.1 hypothetical protein [Candidatus Neomarinimicrobiota bacterium]